ncbi:hypothetical protein TWF718_005220 [Orbilia javanica]|uniref:Lipoprotein n=1 Tax=Orbilia javanica TaxID=47235 RepID=A0AAN8RE36_9PEZI
MKVYQPLTFASLALFSLSGCTPANVAPAPSATTEKPTAKLDKCLSFYRYDPKDYNGWEFECFQNSDCGGGEAMGCHCIIEAVAEFDPSLGTKGLPYYNKVPKCVFIPTIEQLQAMN